MKRTPATFSMREERLLALVPAAPARITSVALASAYYLSDHPDNEGDDIPLNAQKIVVGRMDTIAKKLAHNGDTRRLQKSKRAGPHPIEFWLETAA